MTTSSAPTRPRPTDARLAATLTSRPRPPRPGRLAVALAFGGRALRKLWHVPEQVIDVVAIPVVFTLMFTYLLGGALAGSTDRYVQTLLPGTLMMTIVLLTTFTGVGLVTDRTSGVLDRFRSLPIWRPGPLVGALVGDIGRYVVASALVIGLGLVIGFRPVGGVIGAVAAAGLGMAFAFGLLWVWIVLGLLARTPAAVTSASFVVLFPLTLASNTFVDPGTMPGWLRAFVEVNPISHLVTASRGLMHGTAALGEVGLVLAESAALVVVFFPLAMRRYRAQV